MKYLYLLIRHVFPRHRWTETHKVKLMPPSGEHPYGMIIILRDQFGNIREKKIYY